MPTIYADLRLKDLGHSTARTFWSEEVVIGTGRTCVYNNGITYDVLHVSFVNVLCNGNLSIIGGPSEVQTFLKLKKENDRPGIEAFAWNLLFDNMNVETFKEVMQEVYKEAHLTGRMSLQDEFKKLLTL